MENRNPKEPEKQSNESVSKRNEDLLWDYIERLNKGEALDDQRLRNEHPDIANELIQQIRAFQDIGSETDFGTPLGTLGDYTLRRQIGRGGMGVVYEAWENSLERRVALKVLPPGIAADARSSTRFLREAQIAAKLSHSQIVPVHATGIKDGTPWYVMEYVEGETLAQVLTRTKDVDDQTETPFGKKGELASYSNLASAFADVADGLQHAHSKGVIHRDIKPSNLILDQEGRLRILDFGLARLEGQESLTISGDLVGTPLYMSPEQARQKKIQVDHRTDIYSLGATMFEAVCGRPPFRGKNHQDTLSQIVERDPVEPRKVNPRVPKDFETVVLKCLRKEPESRYGTAEALGQDLRRFVRGDPIEARPQGRWEKARRQLARHQRMLFTGSVIICLVLACGVLTYMLKIESEKKTDADPLGGCFDNVSPLSTVNTSYADIMPVLSANQLEFFFSSNRPGGQGDSDIWTSTRAETLDSFVQPGNVQALNTRFAEVPAWISRNGLELFFTSNRKSGSKAKDIYLVTRENRDKPWGEPKPVEELNTEHHEGAPTLTGDRLEVYFSSNRSGGNGKYIWRALRTHANSSWQKPTRVEIDGKPQKGDTPAISPDGCTLFFASRQEIWYTTRDTRDGHFSGVINLGPPVNSVASWEGHPIISHDWPAAGAFLYFVRIDKMPDADIYRASWRPGEQETSP